MTRSVIRLPACPVSDYRPHARAKRIAALAMTASLGLLASCTTLGTNISGKFACGAPEGGSCSPAPETTRSIGFCMLCRLLNSASDE